LAQTSSVASRGARRLPAPARSMSREIGSARHCLCFTSCCIPTRARDMDRKAMVRAYRDTPRPAGVFRVTHAASGRTLLGSSPDAPAMLNRIRAQLRMKGHPKSALQADWEADGVDGFSFEILELLEIPEGNDYNPAEDLAVMEELWLEKLKLPKERRY
jgi:hypothetical protein